MSEGSVDKKTEKPQIEAVIFDLDGLLIDSEVIWNRAYYKFIEIKNLPHEPEIAAQFVGKGLKDIIKLWQERYGLEGDKNTLLEEYRAVFYAILFNSEHFRLMDGAGELIRQLHGQYKLSVCTGGHDSEHCSQILKKLRIDQYFDVVISSDDFEHGKPSPDVYLETAERVRIKPAGCLALEDSANGVLSAKAAGMKVYGVNPEYAFRTELTKAGADAVYSSLQEVEL